MKNRARLVAASMALIAALTAVLVFVHELDHAIPLFRFFVD